MLLKSAGFGNLFLGFGRAGWTGSRLARSECCAEGIAFKPEEGLHCLTDDVWSLRGEKPFCSLAALEIPEELLLSCNFAT